MSQFMADFHFLRPLWLLALLPGLLLMVLLWRNRGQNLWRGVIDAELLQVLLPAGASTGMRLAGTLFGIGWLIAILAVAGPSWSQLPQPVRQSTDALVLILGLGPSMNATDVQPSRAERARRKLHDILQRRDEGLSALIVYSGDAHVVTPLTDDTGTISTMLPALSPEIMPVAGNNLVEAVNLAHNLVSGAGLTDAHILLLTDSVKVEQRELVAHRLEQSGLVLSVLGIGTENGAPVPYGDGGFLRDAGGAVAIARLDEPALRELATHSGGRYRRLRIDEADIDALLPAQLPVSAVTWRETQRKFDLWLDQGSWLLLALLPLAAIAFRRGWLLMLPILFIPPEAKAFEWSDLWRTRDQQGARAMAEQDPGTAAKLFQTPDWQGAALYENGDYPAAIEAFSNGQVPKAEYNRGNALARAGQLEEAPGGLRLCIGQEPRARRCKIQSPIDRRPT